MGPSVDTSLGTILDRGNAVVVRLSSDQKKRAEALGRIIQETEAALRQARSDSPETIVDLLARRSEAEAELNSIVRVASAERFR